MLGPIFHHQREAIEAHLTIPADPTPGPDARTILDRLPAITLGHWPCESQGEGCAMTVCRQPT